MPATLLLRLAGPMQAWGIDSRFDVRDTLREPTKSGVIGLLCAALGKPREERTGDGFPLLAELATLRMGVRVDREGTVAVDYQTAGGTHRQGDSYGVRTASDKPGKTVQSRRYYLADASFLVAFEGDRALLERLGLALQAPAWPLSLGRKAFAPGVPVHLPESVGGPTSVVPLTLDEALRRLDWNDDTSPARRVVLDADPGPSTETRQDVPLDFAVRRFGIRHVAVSLIEKEGA